MLLQQQQQRQKQPRSGSRSGAFQALRKKKKFAIFAFVRCSQNMPAIRWEIELKSVQCRSNGVDLHIFLLSLSFFSVFSMLFFVQFLGQLGIILLLCTVCVEKERNVLPPSLRNAQRDSGGRRSETIRMKRVVNAKCTFC